MIYGAKEFSEDIARLTAVIIDVVLYDHLAFELGLSEFKKLNSELSQKYLWLNCSGRDIPEVNRQLKQTLKTKCDALRPFVKIIEDGGVDESVLDVLGLHLNQDEIDNWVNITKLLGVEGDAIRLKLNLTSQTSKAGARPIESAVAFEFLRFLHKTKNNEAALRFFKERASGGTRSYPWTQVLVGMLPSYEDQILLYCENYSVQQGDNSFNDIFSRTADKFLRSLTRKELQRDARRYLAGKPLPVNLSDLSEPEQKANFNLGKFNQMSGNELRDELHKKLISDLKVADGDWIPSFVVPSPNYSSFFDSRFALATVDNGLDLSGVEEAVFDVLSA